MFAAAWAFTYSVGGTRTAAPHVFYLPVVLAALVGGPIAGGLAGLVATVLCGPLMPLDTATSEAQTVVNWSIRGAFFISVGAFVGAVSLWIRRITDDSYRKQVIDLVRTMMPADVTQDDDQNWDADIDAILTQSLFYPVFQPIYALQNGELFAIEALTRFARGPKAPPDVWFARAASAGREVELELATLTAALEAYKKMGAPAPISLNASPECLQDERLHDLMEQAHSHGVILEVTEHAVVSDYAVLRDALHALETENIRFAVDDAGAGFASLRHIVNLNPDIIKLDSTLVRNITVYPVQYALAETLVDFAHQIDAQIVAEGVEEAPDLIAWRDLGADAVQGYLLAHPSTDKPQSLTPHLV